jgi:hypothetical protein
VSLLEYYESGNAPHEALGRAARRVSTGGAIYLGGGVGVEKQSTPKGDIFHVTKGDGSKSEQFTGPLSAAIRAFTIAGGSTAADSPGGASAVADPAAAARLRELKDAQAETESDIRRYEVRLARRQSKPQPVFRPGIVDDDAWEQRRLDELRSDLTRIKAEQAKLIASGKVEEVEQARPGTNFTKIPPKNVKKLSGIVAHYKGMAHGFTACVRDQVKHGLSEDHAKRRCAVVTDLGQGTTKWRKGGKGKVSEESVVEAMLTLTVQEALARCAVVEEQFGPVGLVQLAEGVVEGPALVRELSEAVGSDFVLLALAGHPLAEAVFGLAPVEERSEHWRRQPRDDYGKWRDTFQAAARNLRAGKSLSLPDGRKISAVARRARVAALDQTPTTEYLVEGRKRGDVKRRPGQRDVYEVTTHRSHEEAVQKVLDASARDTHPQSLGGGTSYEHEAHARTLGAKFGVQGKSQREADTETAQAELAAMKPGETKTVHGWEVTKVKGGKFRLGGGHHEMFGDVTQTKAKALLVSSADTNRRMANRPAARSFAARMAGGREQRPEDLQGKTSGTLTKAHLERAETHGANPQSSYSKALAQSGEGAQRRRVFEGMARDLLGLSGDATEKQVDDVADAYYRGVRKRRGDKTPLHASESFIGGLIDARAALSEGFGGNTAASDARKTMNPEQRRRSRAASRAAGTPGTLRSDGKSPKPPGAKTTSTSSSSDASKHPRGQKGTSQGGKFVSKGSSGSTVKQVQQRVGATVDGQFGSQTQAKVRSFQQRHGLKVDGVVGRQTALALAGHFPKARQTKPGELSSADHTRLSKLPKRPTRPRSSAPVRSGGGRVVR